LRKSDPLNRRLDRNDAAASRVRSAGIAHRCLAGRLRKKLPRVEKNLNIDTVFQ